MQARTKFKGPRQLTSLLAVGMALALLLVACGDGAEEQDPAVDDEVDAEGFEVGGTEDDPIVVTVWFPRDDQVPAGGFDRFHDEYPTIRVDTTVVPAEEQVSSYLRASQAGDAPDILIPTTDLWIPLAQQGRLLDIGPYLEAWEADDPEGFAANAVGIEFGTSQDGVTYGVGLTGAPTWMTYRADWFEEAGIETPETYEDLLEAARVLKEERPDVTPFGIVGARAASPAAKFLTLFYMMGGTHEDGVHQFDSEAGIYLLEYYQTLMREDLANSDTLSWDSGNTRGGLMEGIIGTTMISQNIYPQVIDALEYGEEWDMLPGLHREGHEDERVMTFRAVTGLITADTENPYETSLVLRYLADFENSLEVSLRYQPTLRADVNEDPGYLEQAPWLDKLQPYLDEARPLPAHPSAAELYQVIHDMKQEAIANPDADAAEIAARAQAAMNDIANG